MGTFPGNRRNFPRGEANDRFILDAQQRLPCGYDEASSGSGFYPVLSSKLLQATNQTLIDLAKPIMEKNAFLGRENQKFDFSS